MTAHIHAELMLQYAQDASTTDKPWELWEFRFDEHEKWTALTVNPTWDDDTKYRRKPRTIRIGEIGTLSGAAVSRIIQATGRRPIFDPRRRCKEVWHTTDPLRTQQVGPNGRIKLQTQ